VEIIVFKFKEDRLPVAVILSVSLLDFIVFFTVESVWFLSIYWLLWLLPKGSMGAWAHHHQHAATFNSVYLNRVLEFFYALHTGQTTNLWLLHHVLGHHHNYLDQTKDESRWKRKDGTQMGEIEYSLNVAATAYPRAYKVGKKHPKQLKTFIIFSALTFLFVALMCYWKPLQGLFLFVLPMVCSLIFVAWVTYDHHAGLETDNHFEASYNIMNRFFNILTGNLGYHTAHHYRQGLHWSKLPELHEEIKHNIPEHLFVEATFDYLFPDLGEAPGKS
jgi:fatty acid desaturase